MSFIRTALGDLPAEAAGVCYAHEHIIIDGGFVSATYPDFDLNSVEKSAAELIDLREAGVSTVVDSMPTAAGRNVLKLAEVSRRSGVHIVIPTGLHLQMYYPPGHWSESISMDDLADLFVLEIESGIDANDANGPIEARTAHRAGVIKVAGSQDQLTASERRNFDAAAEAQRRTGCPILTHTEQGTAAIEQIERLAAGGADLSHVVLSHLDRKPDVAYHREVLSSGVCLEYDSAFRWKGESNPTRDLVLALIDEFPSQIMLGMDAARPAYWTRYGGAPGLTYLYTVFARQLVAHGLSQVHLDRIFIHNPQSAYAFIEPGTPS